MPPSTRNKFRPSTPEYQPEPGESNTVKKTRFFEAYDGRVAGDSLRSISTRFGVSHSTGSRWLKSRKIIGSPAYRRLRNRSNKLGKRSQVSPETCKMLISPSRNPVRDQRLEAQIVYHNLPVKRRQLRNLLKKNTEDGRMYKQAYIQKKMSPKNLEERIQYGKAHKNKGVEDFWQFVVFTDEAHYDPSSKVQGQILREKGHRYDTENIQERGGLTGNKLHFAAWINWHTKADKLEFYNDEEDYIQKPKLPPKPRKTMYESQEAFDARILEWQALRPHIKEVKTKGNGMTQKYYTERLLPIYIEALHGLRTTSIGELPDCQNWVLQEDGDPSHGIRKRGLAQQLKDDNWVINFKHPAQSPDLNPKEAIWNILKQRVRRRSYKSEGELKAILQEEWSRITMEEVRTRIADMPRRCQLLVKTGGKPIKSAQW